MSDIEIFRNNMEWDKSNSTKSLEKGNVDDVKLYNKYGHSLALSMHKGYLGISNSIPTITPKKAMNGWMVSEWP